MKGQEIEVEKVTLELPKAIMDFLRSVEANPEEYLQHSIINTFQSDLDTCTGVWGYDSILKRHNLGPVFNAMNVTPNDAKLLRGSESCSISPFFCHTTI